MRDSVLRLAAVCIGIAAGPVLLLPAPADARGPATKGAAAAEPAPSGDALLQLHRDFWAFRVVEQPLNRDDIPRIERPFGWVPRWAKADVDGYRAQLALFEARFNALGPPGDSVARQVDHELVGAMIARVRWELEVTQGYRRNPQFYVDQTLGALVEALLPPPPFGARRSTEVLVRLSAFPRVLEEARANLDDARAPFARLALEELQGIGPRLRSAMADLGPRLQTQTARALGPAADKAVAALEGYRGWLEARLPTLGTESAVGRDAYSYFLREIALVPYSPDDLLAMGGQEWERSVAFEAYEKNRNRGRPEMPLFPDTEAQVRAEAADERAVRDFLARKGLLTLPDAMPHYVYLPVPGYLRHLAGFGEWSEFTSPTRLTESSTRYVPEPRPDLGYFSLSMAKDPRPIIAHEGVPGHYAQLWLSWQHENEIRRRYVDSGPSEGIGFYAEEMLLQAGLFDDRPKTREVVYNFMRLRALRVEVDVKLATGQITIDEAGAYLSRTVPMDLKTARDEAALFASTPGQAITYQIGKLQVLSFLAEARRAKGDAFDLRAFHDYLWRNGNVPIALQQREYLAEIDAVELLHQAP